MHTYIMFISYIMCVCMMCACVAKNNTVLIKRPKLYVSSNRMNYKSK